MEPRIEQPRTPNDALLLLVPAVHREAARELLTRIRARCYEAGVASALDAAQELAARRMQS